MGKFERKYTAGLSDGFMPLGYQSHLLEQVITYQTGLEASVITWFEIAKTTLIVARDVSVNICVNYYARCHHTNIYSNIMTRIEKCNMLWGIYLCHSRAQILLLTGLSMVYHPVPLERGPLAMYHDTTYGSVMTATEPKLDLKITTNNPHIVHAGEL